MQECLTFGMSSYHIDCAKIPDDLNFNPKNKLIRAVKEYNLLLGKKRF
jgi:hypothetical protein